MTDEVPMVIGFTGRREVGKSTAADYLVEHYGFHRAHPFAAGKKMTEAFLRHYGFGDQAMRMVNGDLKNISCEDLPGRASCRFFMEKLGQFMGAQLGAEWTLGMEIQKIWEANPRKCIVVESLVYESPLLRGAGGKVVMLTRPGVDVEAVETDKAVAALEPDVTIVNDGSVQDLYRKLDALF